MIIHNLNVIPNLRNGRLPLNSNINTVSGSSGGGGGGSVSPETIISVVKPYLDLKLDISTYALDISTLSALINSKAPIDSPNFTGTPTINNNVIYHAGNANNFDTDWRANNINAIGNINAVGNIITQNGTIDGMIVNSRYTRVDEILDAKTIQIAPSGLIKFFDSSSQYCNYLNIENHKFIYGCTYPDKPFKYEVYHTGNANLPTINWNANNINAYGTLYLSGNAATSRYIYMYNGINTHRIASTAAGKFVIARDGIKNDFILDENGNTTLYGTVTSIGNLCSSSNINALGTINASSNISSVATVSGNKVISTTAFKSENRTNANFVGNWGLGNYWGLGEDNTQGWIKLLGCDADGTFNTQQVNLKVSGGLQVGNTLQSSIYSGTGFSASGWGITPEGDLNIKSLTVRELARFYELEIAKIRAVNGGLAITPADGKVTSIDVSANKLYFKDADNIGFQVGDIVRAQKWDGGVRGFKAPVVAIDTVNKSITLGTFIIGDFSQIKVGDDVIVWDSTVAGRDGLIYMSANDSGSPFVDIVKKQATKLRIGNIGNMSWNGTNIPANTLGYWADGDVYINNGFFKGRIEVTGGNVPTTEVINVINASIGNINTSIGTINSSIGTINTNVTNVSTNAATAKTIATDASTKATTAISTVTDLSTNYNTWKPTIKAMAYQDMVEFAKLGTTIIQGGYIKASLIDAATIVVNGGGVNKTYVDGSLGTVNTNITNLNSSVNTATNTANTANSTANTASSTASTANTNANTALSTANSANSTANTAQSGVNSLNTWKATVKAMAYQDTVELAKLGSTIISGGYIKTDLIDVNNIYTRQAYIGNATSGWFIDNYQIYNGSNSVGLEPMIRLSTQNAGSNFIYTGERVLEGLSLTWHRSSNAGHLVFGQLAANGNTLKDGFKGIQMMDWTGNEYFALGANVNVENNGSHYCKIAGWNFDTVSIHKGLRWSANGRGVGMYSEGNLSVISAHKDNNNYVALFDNGSMQGLDCVYGGSSIFRIADTQKYIAGWNFDSYHLYSGYMSINANGSIEHTQGKWRFNNDGSWQLAGRNLYGDADGNITGKNCTFENGKFYGRIESDEGDIGGFLISRNTLSSDTQEYSLVLDSERGQITLIGKGIYSSGYVNIGGRTNLDTKISTTFHVVAPDIQYGITSVGAQIECSEGEGIALLTNGPIVSNKSAVGYGMYYMDLTPGDNYIKLADNNCKTTIVVYNGSYTDNCNICLPKVADIKKAFNIPEGVTSWSISLKIYGKYNTPRRFLIKASNDDYYLKNNDGGNTRDTWYSGGDVIEVTINRWYNEYWAQCTNFRQS